MTSVYLDYSHVDEFHRSAGFVMNRESIDYKLPVQESYFSGAMGFNIVGGNFLVPKPLEVENGPIQTEEETRIGEELIGQGIR